jgi:hypothetical protein
MATSNEWNEAVERLEEQANAPKDAPAAKREDASPKDMGRLGRAREAAKLDRASRSERTVTRNRRAQSGPEKSQGTSSRTIQSGSKRIPNL